MNTGFLYLIIVICLIAAAIITAITMSIKLEKDNKMQLIQGKLQNSDQSISNAMQYLKITNKWSDS